MWAAANDGATARRRRHHDKRRRTDDAGGGGKDQDGAKEADDNDVGSDSDSDSSSDGERSTTESVHNEPSTEDGLGQSFTQASQGDASQPASAAGQHSKKRKRKRKRKKKQIREETAEATMARLKSSYSAAMSAVGALHRVSQQYCAFWEEEGKKTDATGESNVGGEVDGSKARDLPSDNVIDGKQSVLKQGGDNTAGEEKTTAETNETNLELETSQNDNTANEETNAKNAGSTDKQQEALFTTQRVGQAARTALEQSLLLDHIILAPIFLPEKNKKGKMTTNSNIDDSNENDPVEGMSSAWLDAWNNGSNALIAAAAAGSQNAMTSNAACQISLTKWNRLSTAHRTVIKQISYLALVNYADLLLCGCTCRRSNHASGRAGEILDRGAVSNLDVLQLFSSIASAPCRKMGDGLIDDGLDAPLVQGGNSIWCNESTERTIRLALAAYCDASELDSSDPTLWFKLACAARALGWEVDLSSSANDVDGPPRSYRCLERLSLERGISSLPQGVPPNRLLMRAWREMENWDRRPSSVTNVARGSENVPEADTIDDGGMTKEKDNCPILLVLHLPKYSWVTLGRILMRACREGASYGRSQPGALHHVWSTVSL